MIHNAPRGALWITLGFLKKFGPLGALKQFLQSKTNLHHLSSVIKCFKHKKRLRLHKYWKKKMLMQMTQKSRFRTRYGGALWITLAYCDTFALIQITFKEYFGLIDSISLWL